MSHALNETDRLTGSGLPDASIIERAISALSGVCGSRVVMQEGSEIKELHVLASSRRAPKKIIRDIESLLLVQYGYRIDYRRISLAQVTDASQPQVDRLALGRVEQIRTPQGRFIEAALVDGQQTYRATYPLGNDAAYAAGKATVAALNALFAPAAPLDLRGVQCSTIGMRQVVTVYVMYKDTEHLLGTAFVRGSVAAATARAVLAATNRRLNEWVQEHTPLLFADTVGA